MNRRGFLKTLGLAPTVILTPGLLMPVRKFLWLPTLYGDGITDDSEALQALIDGKDVLWRGAVFNGMDKLRRVVSVPTATYTLSKGLTLAHEQPRTYDFGHSTLRGTLGMRPDSAIITIPNQEAHTTLQCAKIERRDGDWQRFSNWSFPTYTKDLEA